MRLIDADALKYKTLAEVNGRLTYVLTAEEIDNAPTVEEREVSEREPLKPTKDLINDIVGFDISGLIESLPEFKEEEDK